MTVDLSTTYLGLRLHSPLVVSAGPISERSELWARIEGAGAGAIVLPSLWEEEIDHYDREMYRLSEFGAESSSEATNYFPTLDDYRASPSVYLNRIVNAKKVLSIPVIGNLNGVTPGGWIRYAKMIQDSGADALELNIYFLPTAVDRSAAEVEDQYLTLISAVRAEIQIPLAVKIGPYFSALPHFARRVEQAGANGLVLFNRFLQPEILLDTLEVTPNLVLSSSKELRLPLRWIAILRDKLKISLAGNSGVHSAEDVAKLLLAGADVAMLVSVLIQKGVEHLRTILNDLDQWMTAREYTSIEQMKGSLCQANCPDPEAFERANYMKAVLSYCGPFV